MDQMVLATQQWLNAAYEGETGWYAIPEDGKTGWTTVYALLRAFQIENGSTTPSNNIGPWTQSKLTEVGMLKKDSDAEPSNNVRILQGTLWCKGYPADGISGVFGDQTEAGVIALKKDIGHEDPDCSLNLYLWYALFSMDQFVLLDGGMEGIREFQQEFNRLHSLYYGQYVPCDGLAGRELYTCFILTLQREEGYSFTEANGNFGPSTFASCPLLLPNLSENIYPDTIRCIKIALWLNGFPLVGFDSTSSLDEKTFNYVHLYNDFMELPDSGGSSITPGTIKSLFTSNGDTSRPCEACDTSKPITESRAKILVANNLKRVGRYLTPGIIDGENKQLTKTELDILKKNNIAVVPIYQSTGDEPDYFTEEQGIADAKSAYDYATALSLPGRSIIYFAVDVDILGADIPGTAVQYFKGVFETLTKKGMYQAGVYGTRNVCRQVIKAGYAVASYVSDMSTGYSGNMGFAMPKNWSFDQFFETEIEYNGETLNIDKVATNHSDLGVYFESDSTTAMRKMAEDVLDGLNLRPLMINASFEVGKKITLLTTPFKVELLASESYSTNVSDADFKITGKLNPNGSATATVSKDIENIAGSFSFDSNQKTSVTGTLTALVEKFPDGTEFYIKISQSGGNLTFKFIVNIPKEYEFNGLKYTGSIEVDVTLNRDNMPSGYSPVFEYALNYNREQAFAAFVSFMSQVQTDLEKVGEGVVVVLAAVVRAAAYASIFGIFLIVMIVAFA